MDTGKLITKIMVLFFTLLAAGCSALGGPEPGQEVEGTPLGEGNADYDSLLEALRDAGASVEAKETLEQPFFEPIAQVITVNGQDVQVFEFENEQAARAAAETVSESGSSVGPTMMTWIDSPHFYRADRLIVLYVGSDDSVLTLLQDVLGEQFAGG